MDGMARVWCSALVAVGACMAGRGQWWQGPAEGCTLLVTGGDWQGRPPGWSKKSCAYEVTGGGPSKPLPDAGRSAGAGWHACQGRSSARSWR